MNVLWIPIFSMRSHETGKYSVLKDGNFQLTMARVLASDFGRVFVAVPNDISDLQELTERFKDSKNVAFIQMTYGINAVETRETFWDVNASMMENFEGTSNNTELLITDITGYVGPLPVVFNFNITKLPELDRPYIDRFFDTDLKSIERSLFTTVLNPRQREYILQERPDLKDKVVVHTKCAHTALLPSVDDSVPPIKGLIFWPFRISDTAYRWDEFVRIFEEQHLGEYFNVVVTDPNDSLKAPLPLFVIPFRPSKAEYYEFLNKRPIVVMLDDIDTVLHPGTIEFFYYGCPTITFGAKLLHNPNAIPTIDMLASALSDDIINYDRRADLTPFVYSIGEIDMLYNKRNMTDAKN